MAQQQYIKHLYEVEENIAMMPYGFSVPVEIICFSTQRHNTNTIRKRKSLPRLSKEFVFVILNNHVKKEIAQRIPNDVAKRLKIDPGVIAKNRDAFLTFEHNKWILLCMLYFLVLLLAYLLIQLQ